MSMPRPPVCIDTFRHVFEAEFLRGLLRENGFDATIASQRGMSGTGARLAANHAVMVPGVQAEEARQFLAELAARREAEDDEAAATDAPVPHHEGPYEVCPNCGSTKVVEHRSSPAARIIACILLLGLPMLLKSQPVYACQNCDWDSRRR